jgi:hypothetical protein
MTSEVTIEELFPERRSVPLESAYADLGLAERAEGLRRPYVVANMVATVDGRATVGGRTKELSSEADRALFHNLREQVDAVMAGTGTIGLERYGPLIRDEARRERRVRRGLAPVPLAVTASRSLELPVTVPLFQDPDARIVVLSNREGEVAEARAQVIVEPVPGPDGRTIDSASATGFERSCTRAARRCSARSSRAGSWTSCSWHARRCSPAPPSRRSWRGRRCRSRLACDW